MRVETLTASVREAVADTGNISAALASQGISLLEEQSTLVDETRKFALDAIKQRTEVLELLKEKAKLKLKKEKIEIKETKKTQVKDEDAFVSALKMAIANDGKIDKKELKHLLKLEKQSTSRKRDKKKKQHRGFFRFRLSFGSWHGFPTIHFRMRTAKAKKEKNRPDQAFANNYVNHSIREAFKLAALDGKINANEITSLKKLF